MSMATVGLEGSRPSVMKEGSQKSILRILAGVQFLCAWGSRFWFWKWLKRVK